MNWAAVSFDWNQVRAFLATVEEGSLSAAARALGLTQPTLGRQVAALEASLGVVLFDRVGRGLALTPAGAELLDHVRAMGEAAGRISLAASGQSQAVEGHVTVTASDGMAAYVLPEILGALRDRAPGITVEIVAANDLRDLRRREADIAIRHVRPEQPDLIAKLVRESAGYVYAAPAYIARHGRPKTIDDLAEAEMIGFVPPARFVQQLNAAGLPVRAENLKIVTDSGVAAWEMVRQGLGLGVMFEDIALRTGGVERVLPDLPPIPIPVWLVTHRELRSSRRIRIVFDHLAEALAVSPQPAAMP